MNPNNYCTLEASQRLVADGIVLETEKVWALNSWPTTIDGHVQYREEWQLIICPLFPYKQQAPAPSMSELWRELPDRYDAGDKYDYFYPILTKDSSVTRIELRDTKWTLLQGSLFENTNPCDALADLLIWVRGREKC